MRNKTKILCVSSYLDIGGLEVLLLNFLRKLDKSKYEPAVCIFQRNGVLEPEFKKIGIPVYRITKKEGIDFLLPLKLAMLIKKHRFDIVHTHNSTPWFYSVLARSFLKGVYLVHTKHSNLPFERHRLLRFERFLVKRTEYVIAVAKDIADFMLKEQRISKNKIKIIHNGVDEDCFSPKAGYFFKKNSFTIGIVARLVPIKDHKTLLLGFKILLRRLKNADLHLLVIGEGQLKNELIRFSEDLGIREKVEFMGQRHDIAAQMKRMDVFVLPSISEGLSVTLLEAMACGLPIVATNVGGNSEIVIDKVTGLLVPSGSPQVLAEALEKIFINKEGSILMGKKGRERILEMFSLSAMTRNYENIYEMTLNKKNRKYKNTRKLKSRKILIIGEFPSPEGGMGRQAELLKSYLKSEGISVGFIKTNIIFPSKLKFLNRIKFLKSILRVFVLISNLIIKIPQYDIVHIFSNSFLNFFLFTLPPVMIGKMFRKKVIINYHGGTADRFLSRYLLLAKPIFVLSDAIVVPSQYLELIFKRFSLEAEIIPNIIELSRFKYKERNMPRTIFLTARHLEKIYNNSGIINAFNLIKQRFPSAQLNIAGDGSERKALEELVDRLGLRDSVRFWGELKNRELLNLYDNSDIFLNASLIDNMPVAILEAYASGVAVISSRAGGIPFVVEDGKTGLLVDLNDHKEMAEKAISLLENKELFLSLIKNAKVQADRCKWENIREKWLKVYSDEN